MIHGIAKATACWLTKTGAVSEEDAPAYEYVVFRAIFTVIPLLMTLVIATVMKMTTEGILMIVPFIMIRRFCGGIHLDSPVICFISSVATLVAILFAIKLFINYQIKVPTSIMTAVSAVSIMAIGTVESKNRPLSASERRVFSRISRVLCALALSVFTALMLWGNVKCAVPIGMGIFLTAALQVIGRFWSD